MSREDGPWRWFHRVFLGTLVEVFRDRNIGVDTGTLSLVFGPDSIFRFPALDNRLRFEGRATAVLLRPLDGPARQGLADALAGAWPDLVREVQRVPVPDRLDVTRAHVEVTVEGDQLVIVFDLDAD
jgi:hypothetical protein